MRPFGTLADGMTIPEMTLRHPCGLEMRVISYGGIDHGDSGARWATPDR